MAPITGRTGIRQVDQGNIVHASDASGIVVITQLQPISVLFTLPQQQLGDVNRAFAGGALPVDAFGPDNKTMVETGELKVVDNRSIRRPERSSSRPSFPIANCSSGPAASSTCGC